MHRIKGLNGNKGNICENPSHILYGFNFTLKQHRWPLEELVSQYKYNSHIIVIVMSPIEYAGTKWHDVHCTW